jgi:triosephosphate isomerase (TIM)
MRKLLAANWKENPKSEKAALKLFKDISKTKRANGVEVLVCPPFIYIEEISNAFKKIKPKKNLLFGAQDVFWEEKGAYTSEVGPKMLKSLSVKYVIIGHSERRMWLHETDAMINKKIKLALKDNLKIILCVGEALAVRKKGSAAAKTFIKSQLKKDLAGISRPKIKNAIIVAYEPIWAIGTGRFDTPEDSVEIAQFIKQITHTKVLYGGSVNRKNVADFVQLKEIDGALVGGASLRAAEFAAMIKVTGNIN